MEGKANLQKQQVPTPNSRCVAVKEGDEVLGVVDTEELGNYDFRWAVGVNVKFILDSSKKQSL